MSVKIKAKSKAITKEGAVDAEALADLTPEELTELNDALLAEGKSLASIADEDLSDDDIDTIVAIGGALDAVKVENTVRVQAETERSEKIAAARAAIDGSDEPAEDAEPAEKAEPAEDEEPAEKEAVVASGKRIVTRGSMAARIAKSAPEPKDIPEDKSRRASLVASANLPGIDTDSELEDLDAVVKAFQAGSRGFAHRPGRTDGGRDLDSRSVARIIKAENEFSVKNLKDFGNEPQNLLTAAGRQSRLPGGSLVAAGGWCAPSEQTYDFCTFETISGILSIPEVEMSRGGVKYTKGPNFQDIYDNIGFLQTETQAIAGTAKTAIEVACPTFQEVRLDAIGFAITSPILTETAYPELLRRYMEAGLIAHAHKVNAYKINKIVSLIGGTPVNYAESLSSTSDVLSGIELNALLMRYNMRLSDTATLEAVAPIWLKTQIRADLANRAGVDSWLSVSDAQIQAFFSARHISIQWVYDWQPLTSGVEFPQSVEVLIYPAGSFVAGTTDVIDIEAVYDSNGLLHNTYLAAFFEEGIAVYNPCAGGVRVAIALNKFGRSGALNVGQLAPVAA